MHFDDQVNLAPSRSFLQLLLPYDFALYVSFHPVPNQIVDTIALAKTLNKIMLMLPNSSM